VHTGFIFASKKTRLAPGCNVIADVLIPVLYFRYGTLVIFGDQGLLHPLKRLIVFACPPSTSVVKRVCGFSWRARMRAN